MQDVIIYLCGTFVKSISMQVQLFYFCYGSTNKILLHVIKNK